MLVLQSIALQLGEAETPLLSNLSAWYPASHFGAILGPSGCGKSTLLKVIAGILPHTSGSIFWQGKDLENEDLPAHQLGYVPQFSCTQPRLSVQENLFYGARLRQKGTRQEIEARVEQVMEETGLQDLQDRRAGVLSGGQLRRLSLAMELTTRPSLLLADEVTSGLDPKSEEEITELLSSLAREQGRLVLLVTHSLRHMESYDSITVLTDGHLAYSADPRDLTDYFRVKSPELIFPTLATQSGQEWANRWNRSSQAGRTYLRKYSRRTRINFDRGGERELLATSLPSFTSHHMAQPTHKDFPARSRSGFPATLPFAGFSRSCNSFRLSRITRSAEHGYVLRYGGRGAVARLPFLYHPIKPSRNFGQWASHVPSDPSRLDGIQ